MCLSAMQVQTKVMNNYMGIGVDAKVSLEFDRLRTKFPHWFKSQMGEPSWLSPCSASTIRPSALHCVLLSTMAHIPAISLRALHDSQHVLAFRPSTQFQCRQQGVVHNNGGQGHHRPCNQCFSRQPAKQDQGKPKSPLCLIMYIHVGHEAGHSHRGINERQMLCKR